MGKVKIKRKSTLIDMTAMSDVTVLLLTFFMLTSTFLQKEPVKVVTPSSVSEIKVPVQKLVTVLVDPQGRVFMSFAGDKDTTSTSGGMSTEEVRKQIFESVVAEYNRVHPSAKVNFTDKEEQTFCKTAMFGMPMNQLKKWLDLKDSKRDETIDPTKKQGAAMGFTQGIPIDKSKDVEMAPNEFQIWIRAAYNCSSLKDVMVSGEGIAIKADADTPYSVVQIVMDNLQTLKMNKFTLMTALKKEKGQ
ncbi:MAG: biopolymer transporter ExbD [Muribaculaceae bacterium]|jgi:biopolymer transport protein ExbD|nr:biopolymer transporter ExbD [Muribaculaceae bacterium]